MATFAKLVLTGILLLAPAACSLVYSADDLSRNAHLQGGDAGPAGTNTAGDSGAGSDARAAPFCQGQPNVMFCRDFDDDRLFSADFEVKKSPIDQLTTDSTQWVSPARSLVVDISASSTEPHAYMQRRFTGPSDDIRLSFDILMSTAAAGVKPARIAEIDARNETDLNLYLTSDAAFFEEYYKNETGEHWEIHNFVDHRPEVGRWAHIDVRISNSNHRLTASLDGVPVVDQPLLGNWTTNGTDLYLGIPYVGAKNTAWRFYYDNVVYDFR